MNTLIRLNNTVKFIKQHISLFEYFDNVYLFGSILDENKAPNDIDLLLIYVEYTDEMFEKLNTIRAELEKICGLYVDLTVLSVEEEKDTEFLKKISPLFLKIK